MMMMRRRFFTAAACLLLSTTTTCDAFVLGDAMVDFSLGAVAGGVGALVAYPADYVTCQMQTESGKAKYKNGMDCFLSTITKEGPMQLFRGVNVQLAGAIPEKAVKLGVNDMMKCMLAGYYGSISLGSEILAASIAGICQVVATSPLEVLKVGLQTSNSTIGELMTEIGGVPGLFQGAEACILRDVLLSATLFPVYTHAQEVLPTFMAGALAGVAAGVVGAPPDFVKTRILARDSNKDDDDFSGGNREPEPTRYLPQQHRQPAFVTPQPSFVMEYRTDVGGDLLALGGGGYDHSMLNVAPFSNIEQASNKRETNPFVVGNEIIRKEGWKVLFTGVAERCIASIPRYGVTLAMHDVLKAIAFAQGWMGAHEVPLT